MNAWKILLIILAVGLWGVACNSPQRPTVDVTIRNDSTNHLDWVTVKWDEAEIPAGVMGSGKAVTILDAGLPKDATTNVAIFEFINEDDPGLNWDSGSNQEVRMRREKSWRRVPVDVSRLLQLGPGHYEVTFRLLSLTNATVAVATTQR
jgi:hypothetical protein